MNKIQSHSYKIYHGPRGKIIVFDEETLTFTEVSPLHVFILKTFCSPKKISDVLFSLIPSKRKEVTRVFTELNELGFFKPLESGSFSKIFKLDPKIRAFRIVLTEECNLRCKECFVTKCRDNLKTMSSKTLRFVINKTISFGTKERITYHFFGGEPLIRFDHIKETIRIVNTAVNAGKMVQPLYRITTNLTFLNEEMIKLFKENNFKVGVSIDGPEDINNKFRIYKNGQGSFKDTKRNYHRLVKAGIDVHILITPHSDFLYQLPKIFRGIMKNFPMKTITVNTPFHYHTLAWNIDGEKYAKTLINLIRIAKKFKVTVDSAVSPILFSLSNNVKRQCPCMFNNDYIMVSVNPEGRISFCSQNWRDVKTKNFKQNIKIPINRPEECKNCEARNICGGPCPVFQLISGKKIDGQKCKFMRTVLKEIAANIDLFH